MARPSKLTPKLGKAIAGRVRDGNSGEVASQCEGIHADTFYDWMKRGQMGEAPFSEFSELVTRARAEAESDALAEVREAADRDGSKKNATWFLERHAPDRWGKRIDVHVMDQANERLIDRIRAAEDPETLKRVLEILSEEDSAEGVS